MRRFVVDASVVVKWFVEEEGSSAAAALLRAAKLMAPDLLAAESANILWKKVARGELSRAEAVTAARLIERSDIEFICSRGLIAAATALAINLGHPAYDCLYLALAAERDCPFVTADERLARKLGTQPSSHSARLVRLADWG